MKMQPVKVRNMQSPNGNDVPNQFIIETSEGTYFQSYNSIIVFVPARGNTQYGSLALDENYWDYSRTTGKYRNMFLNETKNETEAKIKSGEYKLADLN